MTKRDPLAEQCTAKAKGSGQRCQQRVIGGGVCRSHGGNAPQVRGARQRRVALSQALAVDPRRDPGEVLADVGHQADYLMRRAREEVRTGKLTAATMTRLLDLTETAGRWAKTGLEAGVAERQTRALEVQATVLATVVRRILDRLDLTPEQQALVPVVVPAELERMSVEVAS